MHSVVSILTEYRLNQGNGARYILSSVQIGSGVHKCFYPVHKTDSSAGVKVIENSVLSISDDTRFPSARDEKLQWPPLKEIMNFKRNHSAFFTLPSILLDNLKFVERVTLKRFIQNIHSAAPRICRWEQPHHLPFPS